MKRTPKLFLIGMSGAWGACALGLIFGMIYTLYESLIRHRDLWSVLSHRIRFYRMLGGLGIVGIALLFALLLSLISTDHTNQTK